MGWLDKLKNKRGETQGAAKEQAGTLKATDVYLNVLLCEYMQKGAPT